MPSYIYKGRDKEGTLHTGRRFAKNVDLVNLDLLKEGITPLLITVVPDKESFLDRVADLLQGNTVRLQALAIFARQMESLHSSGVSMTTALKQLCEFTRSRKLSKALQGIIEEVEGGKTLAQAVKNYPKVFPPVAVSLIEMGEETGRLTEAFGSLYNYLDFEIETTKQLKAAMRYPSFIVVGLAIAIVILNIFVIPTFANLYKQFNAALPMPTRILIGMSDIFVHYGLYMLIGLVIIVIAFIQYIRTKSGRYAWDRFKLKVPLFGQLLARIVLVRFCRSLAIVFESGLTVTQGLALTEEVVGNQYIAKQVRSARESIERGLSFTLAITKIKIFSNMEIQVLNVGEKNGELAPALQYISDFYAREIAYTLQHIVDWLNPIILSIMGIFILIIALGIYLPIWNMVKLFK